METTLIICATVILIVILVLHYRYKNPYTEEIISSVDMTRKLTYTDGSQNSTDYTLMTIKRTYKNGKSLIITKQL